jgi:hypothetical protein
MFKAQPARYRTQSLHAAMTAVSWLRTKPITGTHATKMDWMMKNVVARNQADDQKQAMLAQADF